LTHVSENNKLLCFTGFIVMLIVAKHDGVALS